MPGPKLRLEEVAKRAGVSRATASKALNRRGDVSAATRERVLAAAKELAEKIESGQVVLKMKAGEGGKAFGSVSGKEIAAAASEQLGLDIDKKKLVLPDPIKTFGAAGGRIIGAFFLSYVALTGAYLLDLMDELDLWKDTMLIVNTDHGFFLSEHGYWGKGGSPNYEELVHTPLFIWDPRSGRKGVHSPALVQTIDLAPTVLDYFGIEIPADMLGRPLTQTLADDTPVREYALFGYHSMPVGITDGRYTLLRDVKDFDEKTYEYTQMPTHMRAMFSVEEMRTATMAPGFSYTKGTPVMKIEARPNPRFLHTLKGGDMLFDLQNDPHQEHVLEDAEQSDRLLTAMTAAFEENDAPEEMYSRYGLKQYRKKAE